MKSGLQIAIPSFIYMRSPFGNFSRWAQSNRISIPQSAGFLKRASSSRAGIFVKKAGAKHARCCRGFGARSLQEVVPVSRFDRHNKTRMAESGHAGSLYRGKPFLKKRFSPEPLSKRLYSASPVCGSCAAAASPSSSTTNGLTPSPPITCGSSPFHCMIRR